MSYYRAKLEDFHLGKVYEQRSGDINKWRTAILTEEHLVPQPGGHFHFMEVIVNLRRFEHRAPYYKIKHLDADDIITLGWTEKLDTNFDDPEEYAAFENGSFTLLLYPESLRVDLYDNVQGNVEKLFTGQLLDISELKLILNQTGVLVDQVRKERVKERV